MIVRIYDVDASRCDCGGRTMLVAVVNEREPIVRILESLGLPSTPPVPAKSRDPTFFDDPSPADD